MISAFIIGFADRVELRHIRYFLAVAEESHFTRAAARLGIGQPPLSQQIRDLEREVGAQLFHRLPHGAELTEAGRAFHALVHTMPAQAAAAAHAARRAAQGETGLLRIGLTGSATLNPLVPGTIRRFRRRYPEVELVLTEGNSTALVPALREGSLDLAFLRPGAIEAPDLRFLPFADEPMIAALPIHHPAAAGATVDLAALRGDLFLLTPRALGPTLYDATMEACAAAGFTPRLGQPAPQMASLLSLVAAEQGVAIVPASMRQLTLVDVAYRDLTGQPPVARLALASLRAARSSLLRNFLALAQPQGAPTP
jgi:DNA-binding transcriptional LysR family regulator